MALTPLQMKQQQLLQMLEVIFQDLEKKGLLPKMEPEERKKLIDKVAGDVFNKVELEDIRELKIVQKALALALMTEFVTSKDPALAARFGHINLFDKDVSLKNHFVLLLTALNALVPDPAKRLTPAAINSQAEKLAVLCKDNPEKSLADNMVALNAVSFLLDLCKAASAKDPLNDTLGALFSRDPRVLGGPARVVGYNPGNLSGIVDQGGDNATSLAFIDVLNKFDGGPDPLGIKNTIRMLLDETDSSVLEDSLKEISAYSAIPKPQGPV
jgi:hypothetical protein